MDPLGLLKLAQSALKAQGFKLAPINEARLECSDWGPAGFRSIYVLWPITGDAMGNLPAGTVVTHPPRF